MIELHFGYGITDGRPDHTVMTGFGSARSLLLQVIESAESRLFHGELLLITTECSKRHRVYGKILRRSGRLFTETSVQDIPSYVVYL
jgi:hypothetical protein